MARHWTKVAVWLAVSACFFAIAAWLTESITEVNRHPVFDLGDALVGEQNISIFTRPSSGGSVGSITVWYGSDREGRNPALYVKVPARTDARILVNNLAKDGCSVPEGRVPVNQYDVAAGTLYLIAPEKRAVSFAVTCKLLQIANAHTFTKQTAVFGFRGDLPSLPNAAANLPTLAAALHGFMPVPREVLNFGLIDGAEEYRFWGGYQDQTLSSFESARALAPNESVSVTWSDANREQLRDLYLVIIGTLVGIAVTTLVEALRILIDTPRTLASVPRTLAAVRRSLSKWVRAAAIEGF